MGARYDFQISPGSTWGHDLRAARPLTPDHRLAKPVSVEGVEGGAMLSDHRLDEGIQFAGGKTVVIMNLTQEEDIQRVYLRRVSVNQEVWTRSGPTGTGRLVMEAALSHLWAEYGGFRVEIRIAKGGGGR